MYPYIQFLGLKISSYGLMMCFACVLVGAICLRRAKARDVIAEDVLIVGACALGAGLFFGGLLFTVITYPLNAIWEYVIHGQFNILFGGIVFYGGLIGGIVGALLGCRIAGCARENIIRVVVPCIPLGHAIGRVGCVLAGCCYGVPYNGPFALHVSSNTSDAMSHTGYFPVQVVEAVINGGICLFLYKHERKNGARNLLSLYLLIYAVVRFGLEYLRGDDIRGIASGLSTSQWISVILMVISIVLIMLENDSYKKHR